MNDRERAQMALLRELVQLDQGDVGGRLADAMHQLALAVLADCVALASTGGFERVSALQPVSLDHVRAQTRAFVAQLLREPSVPPIRDHANLWLPILGETFRGVLYLHTRGVFVDADVDLAHLFATRLETVAHELVGPTNLHLQVRALQYRHVRRALARNGGNVAATARELGVARSFLYRLLNRTDPDEE